MPPTCAAHRRPMLGVIDSRVLTGFFRLTVSLPSSGSKVYAGHPGWPSDKSGVLRVDSGRCGCCIFLLHWLACRWIPLSSGLSPSFDRTPFRIIVSWCSRMHSGMFCRGGLTPCARRAAKTGWARRRPSLSS
jgi:hypothetical protein